MIHKKNIPSIEENSSITSFISGFLLIQNQQIQIVDMMNIINILNIYKLKK